MEEACPEERGYYSEQDELCFLELYCFDQIIFVENKRIDEHIKSLESYLKEDTETNKKYNNAIREFIKKLNDRRMD